MLTFTYMDPAAIDSAVERLQGKYPMQLNASDFRTVLLALHCAAENSSEAKHSQDAERLLSDILSTLEIEYV